MISSQIEALRTGPAHGLVLACEATAEPDRFMRLPEVMSVCGLPESTIRDGVRRGEFPKSIPLGGKSVAWLQSEIRQWMLDRIAARHQ